MTDKPETLKLYAHKAEAEAETIGRYAVTPDLQAGTTLKCYALPGFDDADLGSLTNELQAQAKAASDGDFTRPEAMLSAQAHTLDAVFNDLARRSTTSKYVEVMETYLKLALKAQSQCRSTLEALAEIKAPKAVSFVRQANIAHGHQQVNNASTDDSGVSGEGVRARKKSKSAKQTKQVSHHEQQPLDTGSASQASGDDSTMATVEALDRAENGPR